VVANVFYVVTIALLGGC